MWLVTKSCDRRCRRNVKDDIVNERQTRERQATSEQTVVEGERNTKCDNKCKRSAKAKHAQKKKDSAITLHRAWKQTDTQTHTPNGGHRSSVMDEAAAKAFERTMAIRRANRAKLQ